MKIETICLCSSRKFFDELKNVKSELEKLGYKVLLPSMRNPQDDDTYFREGREMEFAKIHHDLIKEHFRKIENSDAVLVCNWDNNGIKGYIGGNVLIEMAKAFDGNKSIFLAAPVPQIPYRAEILAMQPKVITCLEEMRYYSQ